MSEEVKKITIEVDENQAHLVYKAVKGYQDSLKGDNNWISGRAADDIAPVVNQLEPYDKGRGVKEQKWVGDLTGDGTYADRKIHQGPLT